MSVMSFQRHKINNDFYLVLCCNGTVWFVRKENEKSEILQNHFFILLLNCSYSTINIQDVNDELSKTQNKQRLLSCLVLQRHSFVHLSRKVKNLKYLKKHFLIILLNCSHCYHQHPGCQWWGSNLLPRCVHQTRSTWRFRLRHHCHCHISIW